MMRVLPSEQIEIPIDHSSQVGHARREAMAAARRADLPGQDVERVGIICTEMASNIQRHAGGDGYIVMRRLSEAQGIELLALDRGPGVDLREHMADHHSTAGTLGTGLGAIRRLSTSFDIYVGPVGTAILSQVLVQRRGSKPFAGFGVVCLPQGENSECGDGWALAREGTDIVAMVIDGLGHGAAAADVARRSERLFLELPKLEPLDIVSSMDRGLAGTRGGVILALRVMPQQQLVRCTGIGNIAARILDESGGTRLVSYPGTIGRQTHRGRVYESPCSNSAIIVIHSDGLSHKWTWEGYPGLWHRHPALIAGVLHRDNANGNDDVSVVVLRVADYL